MGKRQDLIARYGEACREENEVNKNDIWIDLESTDDFLIDAEHLIYSVQYLLRDMPSGLQLLYKDYVDTTKILINNSLNQISKAKTSNIEAISKITGDNKGCEYCRMESKIMGHGKDGEYNLSYDDINDGDLIIGNSGHYYLEIFGVGGVDINFCPFCGRKLE